ncbi:DEAD DEAH box helicase, partial [Spiromyces aspiralis]
EAGATKALWQPVYLDQLSVGDPRLLRWSRLAWVSPDEDKYLISFNNRTIYIEKNPDKGMYVAYQRFHMVRPVAGSRQGQQAGSASEHQQPAKRGKFVSRPQMLNMEADTARHAVTACDTYLKQILPFHMWRGLHRQSLWRQKPATPGQLKFLKRLRAPIDDSGSDSGGVGADGQGGAGTKDYGEKSGEVPWLTRGVAANLILQLTNGSGQNWRRKLRQGLRIQKQAAEREQQRRSQALWLEGY